MPGFCLRRKCIKISYQSRSVRLSVRPFVRPSVTFLVSSPKQWDKATSGIFGSDGKQNAA